LKTEYEVWRSGMTDSMHVRDSRRIPEVSWQLCQKLLLSLSKGANQPKCSSDYITKPRFTKMVLDRKPHSSHQQITSANNTLRYPREELSLLPSKIIAMRPIGEMHVPDR
jgi:hypothetical protein